jgi:hypothetical protein
VAEGAVMMARTSRLFLVSASAMSERWHRHGTASAHIIAVFLTLAIWSLSSNSWLVI